MKQRKHLVRIKDQIPVQKTLLITNNNSVSGHIVHIEQVTTATTINNDNNETSNYNKNNNKKIIRIRIIKVTIT